MTYQIFRLPKQTLIGSAAIKPSFKVSFFLTGTTTPAPVYTTSALSVAHTQPVQADSGGVLATIYLDPVISIQGQGANPPTRWIIDGAFNAEPAAAGTTAGYVIGG